MKRLPSHRKRVKIYESRRHLLATFGLILIPFLFLLFFAQIANSTSGNLLPAVLISLLRITAAYFIAAFLGWLFAILFYRGQRAVVALPIFDVLQSLPTFAILPFAILLFGPSNLLVVFFLVVAIIWPVFFSTISALHLVRHDWEEAAKISGLTGWKYLKNFLWPISLPGLITGSIIGLGDGWEVLVATEIIVGSKTGLGNFFQSFSGNLKVTLLGVLGVLIVVFTINKLIWIPLLDWSHQKTEE